MALAFQAKYIFNKPARLKKMSRFVFYWLFYIVFMLINSSHILAIEPVLKENYTVIKNLNESWLVFDKKYDDYVPYIGSRHFNYQSFSQNFEIENYQGYNLLIYSPKDAYIFIDGTFQIKLFKEVWKDIKIDSLKLKHKNKANILLTVFADQPSIEGIEMLVVYKTKQKIEAFSEDTLQTALKPRKFTEFNNFSILFSVLLLSLISFIYNFQDKLLVKFIDLKDLFTIKKRIDSNLINRPFELGNVLFMILLSMSIAMIMMIIEFNFTPILPQLFSEINSASLLSLTSQFLNLSFLILLTFILKYFFISIISSLYQLEKISNLHFFKNLQATGTFAFFLFFIIVLFSIYSFGPTENNKSFYVVVISCFYLLRVLLLFFIILKSNPIKNLYLFSYLCIVELIPLFIGIRLAL